MKKYTIIIGLFLTSCRPYTKIHYSTNIGKCIHNLDVMQEWLQKDYRDGKIPLDVANNYMLVLQNTKCGLLKKTKGDEKEANCIK